MKRFFGLSMVLALVMALAAPATAGRQGPPGPPDGDNTNAKAELCHYSEKSDTYFKVWMSQKGVDKHLADDHGDGLPGDPVPGMEGYDFGDDCSLVEAALAADCYTNGFFSFLYDGNINTLNVTLHSGTECLGPDPIPIAGRAFIQANDEGAAEIIMLELGFATVVCASFPFAGYNIPAGYFSCGALT